MAFPIRKRECYKKYVVICYSVHIKEIVNYDAFDNENDAYTFLEKDAQNTYEEVENSRNSADDIILDIEDGCVELSDIPAELLNLGSY